jgi:hypothetical protein
MAKLEVKVEMPLKWPGDRPRIRFQDRKNNAAWKLTYSDTLKALEKELQLNKVTFATVTYNTLSHEDGGVAVWLSRKPQDDYRWQDEFGFIGTIPTVQELDHAYMQKARTCAPETPTPNLERFMELTKLRDQGRKWIRGERMVEPETVMAVDTFKEVRHNLNAIKLTLAALRQIERCGSPVMMEQAWRGFRPAIAAQASEDAHASSVA